MEPIEVEKNPARDNRFARRARPVPLRAYDEDRFSPAPAHRVGPGARCGRFAITAARLLPSRSTHMKIQSARFEISAPDLASCPESALREFALIGRSNVGKSSLINLLTGRRDLAKVSVTPGKTRLINFFLVNEAWHLVDLPGYGFAQTTKEQRADFNVAVADYLEERPNLVRVLVLIDSRLPPQRIDLEFINWLASCAVPFALVFTKADKKPAVVAANIAQLKKRLEDEGIAVPEIFTSSAETQKGRFEILDFIEQHLDEPLRFPDDEEDDDEEEEEEDPPAEAAPERW